MNPDRFFLISRPCPAPTSTSPCGRRASSPNCRVAPHPRGCTAAPANGPSVCTASRPSASSSPRTTRQPAAPRSEDEGLEHALVCLSCPLGIESLPREESAPLLDAFHDGVRELGAPFGLWGALPLQEPDPADVDGALDAGAAGVSIPAGALVTRRGLERVAPLLLRAEARGAPLLVHPGPAPWRPMPWTDPAAPSWWPALNGYVTQMHEAWFA